MSFKPVTMRLVLDTQVVSFYPKTAIEKQQQILMALNKTLKECGMDAEFLVGATKLSIEEQP